MLKISKMRLNSMILLVCSALSINMVLSLNTRAQVEAGSSNDIRVQAYLKLQQPYKSCVKGKLKELYELSVKQCLKSAGLLANPENCQNLAEKSVNQQAQKKHTTAHCNKLKPSKQDYKQLVDQITNSNHINTKN